jgi:DNA topoisomerase I
LSKRKKAKEVTTDPVEPAKAAGLRYVSDAQPGLHRRRRGTGFSYVDVDGKPVRCFNMSTATGTITL